MASRRALSFSALLAISLVSLGIVAAPGCGDDASSTSTAAAGPGTGGAGAATSSTASGPGGQGGAGAAGCASADDCPASTTPCLIGDCTAGQCGMVPVAPGTPLGGQEGGDCLISVCDGAGSPEAVPDDTDLPDDQNDCTTDGCEGGQPKFEPASAGTACGMDQVCDSAGTCVECLVESDCPGVVDACQHPACNGACSTVFEPNGTKLPVQTDGDCKLAVCDGAGAVTSVDDAVDAPDDNNVCTTDACNGGSPTHTPTPGAACGIGGTCDAQGTCILPSCADPSACPGTDDFCKTKICNGGACGFTFTADGTPLPQQTLGDCLEVQCDGVGNTKSVPESTDVSDDGLECTTDTCNGGVPVHSPKAVGTPCSQGLCNATGQCVQCNGPADCPSAPTCATAVCNSGTCGTSNLPQGTICAPGTCSNGTQSNPDTCNGAGSCVDGGNVPCSPYACGASSCLSSCANDMACASGFVCDTAVGHCSPGPKCTDYCTAIMSNCTGVNGQYSAIANCLAACATFPYGALSDMGGQSTVGCRQYHGGAPSQGDPVTHCTHAGPGGAGVCGSDCQGFCTIALGVCTGANAQYANNAACMAECAQFPTGVKYSTQVTSGDSLACRLYHLNAAAADPNGHCAHIKLVSPTCHN